MAYYAFIDAAGCGGATAPPNPPTTVSTASAACSVNAGLDGTFANWAAYVAAHPTYEIAPGAIPFIIADGSLGTFVVSNITE